MNKQSLDLFRESCGMAGPLALRVDYPGVDEPLQWVLYQPFALIGREHRAHLQLDHDAIGRRHAYLQVVGGRIFFMELETSAVPDPDAGPRKTGWLDEEQVIHLGPYTIRQNSNGRNSADEGAAGPSQPTFPGRQAMPEVTLEFVNKTGRSSTWQMTPLLALVGGSPECRVHLIGDSVSNFHCSLVRTPSGVWVVDLFGKGGVRVNGQLVRQCRLDGGDQLQVGRFLIRVHYDTPPIDHYRPDAPAKLKEGAPQAEEGVQPLRVAAMTTAAAEAPEVFVTPTIMPPFGAPAAQGGPASSHTEMVPLPADQAPQGADVTQPMLVPLAHQLSLMQKQMFDQFQHAMMMMFQMFNTLQKDQIAIIRQELNHQQKLTQELTKLQAELNARQHAPAATASKPWAKPQPSQAPKSAPGPVPPPKVSPTPANGPLAPHAANQGDAGRRATEEEQSFHIWLSKRVHDIQEERETGWKKIVSFLSGK